MTPRSQKKQEVVQNKDDTKISKKKKMTPIKKLGATILFGFVLKYHANCI
jgi:hypothetical protein